MASLMSSSPAQPAGAYKLKGSTSLLLLLLPLALSTMLPVTAQMLSLPTDWRTGIATNYGGAQDGNSPYSPSYGTSIGSCG